MKNLSKKLISAAATIAFSLALPFLASSQAFAQDDDPPPPPRDGRPNEQMPDRRDGDLVAKLNLTLEQIQKIRAIRRQSAEEWRQTRQQMGRAQRALDEAIYSDAADEAQIEARARDLGAAQTAIARLRALTELRIRRVLTEDQLNTLRKLREEAQLRDQERRRDVRRDDSAFENRERPNMPREGAGRPGMLPPGQRPPAGRVPRR